jgi:hypothetical protein
MSQRRPMPSCYRLIRLSVEWPDTACGCQTGKLADANALRGVPAGQFQTGMVAGRDFSIRRLLRAHVPAWFMLKRAGRARASLSAPCRYQPILCFAISADMSFNRVPRYRPPLPDWGIPPRIAAVERVVVVGVEHRGERREVGVGGGDPARERDLLGWSITKSPSAGRPRRSAP